MVSREDSKPVNSLVEMGKLDDQARDRLKAWVEAQMTQKEFARRIERNDPWVSRYFDAAYDADLDTLRLMATACGHTLTELLDLVEDDAEGKLIEAFRSLRPETRETAIKAVAAMSPVGRPARRRKRRV